MDFAATRIALDSSGNVGIGTTAPTKELQVEGEISSSGTGHFANITLARTETIAVNNGNLYYTGGNLGIGTTDPTVALDVSGSSNVSSRIKLAKHFSGTSKILQVGADRDTTAVPFIGAESNHAFDIITNNTQRVRIEDDGDISIKTNEAKIKADSTNT